MMANIQMTHHDVLPYLRQFVQSNAKFVADTRILAKGDVFWPILLDTVKPCAMDEFILLKLFRKALHLCCMNRTFRELKALIGNPS